MVLQELYQELIIDHGKQPRNFGYLPNATHSHAGHNPLCGDKLTVYLITQNGKVNDLRFEGNGCAISVASASLMTEAIKGKTITEVEKLFSAFQLLVTEGITGQENLGKLSALSGVIEFPMRVKCATLAWHTLKAALNHDPQITSTE